MELKERAHRNAVSSRITAEGPSHVIFIEAHIAPSFHHILVRQESRGKKASEVVEAPFSCPSYGGARLRISFDASDFRVVEFEGNISSLSSPTVSSRRQYFLDIFSNNEYESVWNALRDQGQMHSFGGRV